MGSLGVGSRLEERYGPLGRSQGRSKPANLVGVRVRTLTVRMCMYLVCVGGRIPDAQKGCAKTPGSLRVLTMAN